MAARTNAKRFSRVMRELAKVPSRASKEITKKIAKEIQKQMDASQDPYGEPWPLKANKQRSILKKSGKGRASIRVVPTIGAGFKITIGLIRMVYHQFGGASHLRGNKGNAEKRYRDRKKHPDFGRDADRGGKRNRPPQRMFLPFDRLPRSWGEIVLAELEATARKVICGG